MLSDACFDAYIEQYGRGTVSLLMPDGTFCLTIGDKEYVEPVDGESDDTFMYRLMRSKEQGENLFAKEWPEYEEPDETDPEFGDIWI